MAASGAPVVGLGFALVVAGEAEQAIEFRAVELSPRDPNLASYTGLCSRRRIFCYSSPQRRRNGHGWRRQPSSHFIAHMHLVAALALLEDATGTRRAKQALLQLKPDFSAEYVTKVWPFRRSADAAQIIEGLRKAGL